MIGVVTAAALPASVVPAAVAGAGELAAGGGAAEAGDVWWVAALYALLAVAVFAGAVAWTVATRRGGRTGWSGVGAPPTQPHRRLHHRIHPIPEKYMYIHMYIMKRIVYILIKHHISILHTGCWGGGRGLCGLLQFERHNESRPFRPTLP